MEYIERYELRDTRNESAPLRKFGSYEEAEKAMLEMVAYDRRAGNAWRYEIIRVMELSMGFSVGCGRK